MLPGLLDGRQLPRATAVAPEGPQLGGFDRPLGIARHHAAGGLVAGDLLHGETHRDGGVIGLAFAPGFRQVALQKADVGRRVDHALARLLVELLLEVAGHLRRGEVPESRHVLARISPGDLLQRPLEGGVIGLADADLVAAPAGARSSAGTAKWSAAKPSAQCAAATDRRGAAE